MPAASYTTPVRIFLSYSRSDDEPFVWRLHEGLKAAGFEVWFDHVAMPSRQMTFSAEIESAIANCDRLVFVVGPSAVASDYVMHEWRFAFHKAVKCVNAILRLGAYEIVPEDLRGPHVEDFREDAAFDLHLANLVRQLSEPVPPLGKLVAVPALPPHYLEQGDRIRSLRDIVLADLRRPVVVSGAPGRVGLHGMGGIGKSLLAAALARRPEVRREFSDGIYWVGLHQQPAIVQLQHALAKALGDEPTFAAPQGGRERLAELLKDRAALLILDDVWSREDAEAFSAIGPRCRLLLTTRDAGLIVALAAKENHYQVQLPTESDARAILARASGVQTDALPDEANDVIGECDRLPLALALCGGMVFGGTSWADVLDALRKRDLQFLADSYPSDEQHTSIWKAIDVSVRVLDPETRQRFAELGVYATDIGITEAAIETLWEHTGGLAGRHARRLLRDLATRSLVQVDATGRMTLHDLVYGYVSCMPGSAGLNRKLIEAYRQKCADGWWSGPNDGYFFEKLCTHLEPVEAARLLASARWGLAKVGAGLALSLEQDFRSAPQDETLRMIHRALRLAIHVLAKDATQYAPQMVGRLIETTPNLKGFIDEMVQSVSHPWLRPLRRVLQSPGALVQTLAGHSDPVSGVALTADGRRVVSVARGCLKIWDLDSGRELPDSDVRPEDLPGVAVSTDGRRAVIAMSPLIAAAGLSGARLSIEEPHVDFPIVWDLELERVAHLLKGGADVIEGVALTGDGQCVIAGSKNGVTLWDLNSGGIPKTLEGHKEVLCVALTRDGRLAISGSRDCKVRVSDVGTGRLLRELEGHSGAVRGVGITPDGRWAVSASDDSTLKVWDLETLCVFSTLEGHSDAINGVVLTPDGKLAVSASRDHTLKVWDLFARDGQLTPESHQSPVGGLAVTADGRRAISTSLDEMRVWNMETYGVLRKLDLGWSQGGRLAVTPDGRLAITGAQFKKWWRKPLYGVRLWDLDSCSGLRTLQTSSDFGLGLAVTPDGTRFLIGDTDRRLRMGGLQHGTELLVLKGHSSAITAVAITPGCRLAVSASSDRTLKVWDLVDGCELRTLEGHTEAVSALAVTPDGRRAVSGAHDGMLKVWDIETGRELRSMKGHTAAIRALVATADGHRVISASEDTTLRVWDISGNVPVACYSADAPLGALAASPDGQIILAGDQKGGVHFLRLEGAPVEFSPRVLTITREWQFASGGDANSNGAGSWEDGPGATCYRCGTRSVVPTHILTAIAIANWGDLTEWGCPRCSADLQFIRS